MKLISIMCAAVLLGCATVPPPPPMCDTVAKDFVTAITSDEIPAVQDYGESFIIMLVNPNTLKARALFMTLNPALSKQIVESGEMQLVGKCMVEDAGGKVPADYLTGTIEVTAQ